MAEPTPSGDVAALQHLVLTSMLTGRPLPGAVHVPLPAAARDQDRRPMLLLDENIAAAGGAEPNPARLGDVELVDRARLEHLAAEGREPRYLQFDPAQQEPGRVVITVNVEAQRRTGPVRLEGVVVTFLQVGGQWVAEPPAAFAT